MDTVGETEIRTQERVVTFSQKTLGYNHLGNWQARPDNSNVEKDLLTDWLRSRQCDDEIIAKVLYELDKTSALGSNRPLVAVNREVYELLRYGVNPDLVLKIVFSLNRLFLIFQLFKEWTE